MATAPFHHGIRVTEVSEGINSIRIVSTAVIGLVATASDADAATFPLNRPVLVTKVDAAIGKAGTKGTLAQALNAIKAGWGVVGPWGCRQKGVVTAVRGLVRGRPGFPGHAPRR